MSGITLAQAEANLAAWIQASIDVATKGQAYEIDGDGSRRAKTRVNAEHIDRMITYWSGKVSELQLAASTTGNNGSQVIYAGRVQ